MEVKNRECEREAKETDREEDTIHTIVFTAGTVLLMVCLKRFLVEQWRAWVFLVLNLILLAILFMSLRPRSSANEGVNAEEVKNGKTKKKNKASEFCEEIIEDAKDCYGEQCWTSDFQNVERGENKEEEEVVVVAEAAEDEVPPLSKEELNERVEAFITMFRQHLASDARQAENYKFQRNSNMTHKGLKCLIVEA
ncbi:hypothetical protein QN277_012591 [Acacia crassicarpa]|uniref:Uncharacterized protein n=1 Tax=Acacia crassicarpa TaxID=499986 RepID=A0AAE1N1J7_9FABA|nr:hypothetical protein QN277_012591 [Acacia crassicarpa]